MIEASGQESDVITVILGGGRGHRLDPLTRERAQAGGADRREVPPHRHPDQQLHPLGDGADVRADAVQLGVPPPAPRQDVQVRPVLARLRAASGRAAERRAARRGSRGPPTRCARTSTSSSNRAGELVLILSGDHMYRMDYRRLLREHLGARGRRHGGGPPVRRRRDLRIRRDPRRRGRTHRRVSREAKGRGGARGDAGRFRVARALRRGDRAPVSRVDGNLPVREAVPARVPRKLDAPRFRPRRTAACRHRGKVQSFLFDGYWRDIGTIRAFYDAHMDLVQADPPFHFNDPDWPFYTHPRYLPGCALNAVRINRSIVSEGTTLDECTIERSIIGVRTTMTRATVRRSLVMGADPYPPAGPRVTALGHRRGLPHRRRDRRQERPHRQQRSHRQRRRNRRSRRQRVGDPRGDRGRDEKRGDPGRDHDLTGSAAVSARRYRRRAWRCCDGSCRRTNGRRLKGNTVRRRRARPGRSATAPSRAFSDRLRYRRARSVPEVPSFA